MIAEIGKLQHELIINLEMTLTEENVAYNDPKIFWK